VSENDILEKLDIYIKRNKPELQIFVNPTHSLGPPQEKNSGSA